MAVRFQVALSVLAASVAGAVTALAGATPAGAATTPVSPAPISPAPISPAVCTTNAKLVPTCGVLWGAAAGGFSDTPRDQALLEWERQSGRTAAIFHTYHRGDEAFPTAAEIAMTRDAARPRVLMLNWRVDYGTTWADVAGGGMDARIDAFAARIRSTYATQRFFLALNHEPEDDVRATAGSGMRAKDFAAMHRHVVLRLRAQGVRNMVSVVAYMGNEKWMSQSWWHDLYPGDGTVDWIGIDSYVSAEKGTYHYGMFGDLLDRKGSVTKIGFYDWAEMFHPGKPVMIAEWGVYHRAASVTDKSPAFNSVVPELKKRPTIKAILYFDCVRDMTGDRNINIASTRTGLASFRKLAADPIFAVKLR